MANLFTDPTFPNLINWNPSGFDGAPTATGGVVTFPSLSSIDQTVNVNGNTVYYFRFFGRTNQNWINAGYSESVQFTPDSGPLSYANPAPTEFTQGTGIFLDTFNWTPTSSTPNFIPITLKITTDVTTTTINVNFTAVSATDDNVFSIENVYIGESSQYCFGKGTKILCLNKNNEEEYVAIEKLDVDNHLVKTYKHGYRKIHKVVHSLFKNDVSSFLKSMYRMPKHGDMTDDLIVTGGHSILVDNYETEEIKTHHRHLFGGELDPIDDKHLLLAGQTPLFEQIQGNELFDIYHIALEGDHENHDSRYGIWANGVLTESTYKKVIYKMIK